MVKQQTPFSNVYFNACVQLHNLNEEDDIIIKNKDRKDFLNKIKFTKFYKHYKVLEKNQLFLNCSSGI